MKYGNAEATTKSRCATPFIHGEKLALIFLVNRFTALERSRKITPSYTRVQQHNRDIADYDLDAGETKALEVIMARNQARPQRGPQESVMIDTVNL